MATNVKINSISLLKKKVLNKLYYFALFICFFSSYNIVFAQQKSDISDSDKKKIIEIIINRTNFQEPDSEDFIYISSENLSESLLETFPTISGKEIRIISRPEIDEKSKSGITFWQFSEFKVERKGIFVSFFRTYWISTGFMDNFGVKYQFKKVGNNWKGKIKGWVIGMS